MTDYRDPNHLDPKGDFSITQLVKFIREKMFGVDVRESIAKALEKVYEDASKNGNANMEVSQARGFFSLLKDRLDNSDNRVFQKADKSYVDTVLSSIASGGPKELFYSLAALKTKYPSGAQGTYLVFDTIHADGAHSYMWKDSAWVDLGLYQSDGLDEKTQIDLADMRNSLSAISNDMYLVSEDTPTYFQGSLGYLLADERENNARIRTKFISVKKGTNIRLRSISVDYEFMVFEYNANKAYISKYDGTSFVNSFNVTNDITRFARIVIRRKSDATLPIGTEEGINVAINRLSEKPQKVTGSIENYTPKWYRQGLYLTNGVVYDNKGRLRTNFIRAQKGSVVRLANEYQNRYAFIVFEYSTDSDEGFLFERSPSDYKSDDYIVVSDKCNFIRVLMIRTPEEDFPDIGASSQISIYPVVEKAIDYQTQAFAPNDYYVSTIPMHDLRDMFAYNDLIDKWDKLVTDFPTYVKKTLMGKDTSGLYDIFRYTSSPTGQRHQGGTVNGKNYTEGHIPTIILVGGVHGAEKPIQLALLNFFEKMSRDWIDDEVLTYLRWNFKFEIIPCANPWGYEKNKRSNVNNVDINRNFDAFGLWSSGDSDPQSDRYRGEAPLSEKETKYIDNLLKDYQDNALLFMDFHTYGVNSSYLTMTMFSVNNYKYNEPLVQAGFDLNRALTISGWKNHNLDKSSGWIGAVGSSNNIASAQAQATKYGINSSAPEGMYNYYNQDNGYSTDVNNLNTEYVVNAIMFSIRRLLFKNF